MNKNPEITSVCSTLHLCNKIIPYSIILLSMEWISFKQTVSITEIFHFKNPRLGFSFLPPVSFEIIQCKFF